MSDHTNLLKEFIEEAIDLVDDAESSLLIFSKKTNLNTQEEEFIGFLRNLHSLKGAAGMFELHSLKKYIHDLEEYIKPLDIIEQEDVQLFLDALDEIRKMIESDEDYVFSSLLSKDYTESEGQSIEKIYSRDEKVPLIYIVDDEVEILELYQDTISTKDLSHWQFEYFSSAEILLNKLDKNKPDLVISDIKMPVISGIDLYRRVKEMNFYIPFIFISGYVDHHVEKRVLELGASAIVSKPFSPDNIENYIIKGLKEKKHIDLINDFSTISTLYINKNISNDDYKKLLVELNVRRKKLLKRV